MADWQHSEGKKPFKFQCLWGFGEAQGAAVGPASAIRALVAEK